MTDNLLLHKAQFDFPTLDINIEEDLLLIDKPYLCTSFDIIQKLKNLIKKEYKKKVKIGHAGTLDPLATGLLIVCIGKKTKDIQSIQVLEKEYVGTFQVGATTASFDLEKPVNETFEYLHITKDIAEDAARQFIGEIMQIPPAFSAVKYNGKRSFSLARNGENVILQPKSITIRQFEITKFCLPDIDFRICCSKGTYIRSIARDFGILLNSGAHLIALRRTAIGNYNVNNAIKVVLK